MPHMKGVLDSVVIESLTEHVRMTEFPDRPSRATAVFGFHSVERAKAFVQKYRSGTPHLIYEVEPLNQPWYADMNSINAGLEYFTMTFRDSLARQLERSRDYLRPMTTDVGQAAGFAETEVLAPGGVTVVRVAEVVP